MSVLAIRHGETEWSLNGRHTGTTDVPLTDHGRRLAELLWPALSRRAFALVLVSPLQRARETCQLAGLAAPATIEPDLVEWSYEKYEGPTPKEIAPPARDGHVYQPRDGSESATAALRYRSGTDRRHVAQCVPCRERRHPPLSPRDSASAAQDHVNRVRIRQSRAPAAARRSAGSQHPDVERAPHQIRPRRVARAGRRAHGACRRATGAGALPAGHDVDVVYALRPERPRASDVIDVIGVTAVPASRLKQSFVAPTGILSPSVCSRPNASAFPDTACPPPARRPPKPKRCPASRRPGPQLYIDVPPLAGPTPLAPASTGFHVDAPSSASSRTTS